MVASRYLRRKNAVLRVYARFWHSSMTLVLARRPKAIQKLFSRDDLELATVTTVELL